MINGQLLAAILLVAALLPTASTQSCNVDLVAGVPGTTGRTNGQPLASTFLRQTEVAMLPDGSFLIVDETNRCIRKYVPGGLVSTFSGVCGSGAGDQDGTTGPGVLYGRPYGIHVSPTGRIFVSDRPNKKVWLLNQNGGASPFCQGFSGVPHGMFEDPDTLALYVADGHANANDAIRLCPANGGTAALWTSIPNQNPHGVHIDSSGTLYVAAYGQHQILTIDRTTKAVSVFCGDGNQDSDNGLCGSASFKYPIGITSDSTGTVYVTDLLNHRIRAIASGSVSTLAGSVQGHGVSDCTSTAKFYQPIGIVSSAPGRLFVSDFGNSLLKTVVTEPAPTHDPAVSAFCDDIATSCASLAAECATIRNGGHTNVADDCDTSATVCNEMELECRDKAASCPFI